jgi:hypothetical protein
MMFINIITPCSRPQNLHKIADSINIPKENYRWIVVCDSESLPDKDLIPNNCEIYTHKNPNSISGNSQRNFALDLISKGYVYFNDDDTLVHQDLWENIKDLDNDFITFYQLTKQGNIRLLGEVKYQRIDSNNFLLSREIIGNTRWVLNRYEADGLFAIECYQKSKNPMVIKKPLSIYNQLR